MSESCCSSITENGACELPRQKNTLTNDSGNICPVCGVKGKPVQDQTVKALLAVSLREVKDLTYLFCKTQTCPVVYFSSDGKQTFTVDQVRERVYQKEPMYDDVLVCYCFQHKVRDIRSGSHEERKAIIEDINSGISLGQCACDLRNPQGSCCLGNVRGLVKVAETAMKDLK